MFKELMLRLSYICIPLVLAITLISGEVKINFWHHHELPSLNNNIVMQDGNIYSIYLSDEIDSNTDRVNSYIQIEHLLHTASSKLVFNFYLQGNGGYEETALALINAMRLTKAEVNTFIVGNVYSAHAMISLAGKNVYVAPNVLIMVHRGSHYNESDKYCADKVGKSDRGLDAQEKCLKDFAALETWDELFVISVVKDYIPAAELKAILKGEDLFYLPNKGKDYIKLEKIKGSK
jgi:ATP-dependent protease ClpP protease subunit